MKNKIIGAILFLMPFLAAFLLLGFSEGFIFAFKLMGMFVVLLVLVTILAVCLVGGLILLFK